MRVELNELTVTEQNQLPRIYVELNELTVTDQNQLPRIYVELLLKMELIYQENRSKWRVGQGAG